MAVRVQPTAHVELEPTLSGAGVSESIEHSFTEVPAVGARHNPCSFSAILYERVREFADCLPPEIARDVLRLRAVDVDSVAGVLRQPRRIVRWDSYPSTTVRPESP
jgi:hypothetical protein